ncbi:MAG: efflux RND transporter periplasmic adaptor subunit [Parvibaculum sp.]|nr:efflux RND transporter periplasmic adaptor subunit [Parvibaculum sp.]|tara:strand:- start:7432 stop:8556 length:1125 start_codon:yes stop_codon:yes gene_type:complete
MAKLNKNTAIGVGAVAGVAFLGLVVWRLVGGHDMGPPPPPVIESVLAAKRDVQVEISALGTLDGDQSIVVSSEINGIVTSIDFVDGQRLAQGDMIVSIDSGSLKAHQMQAQARVTLTRANFDRAQRLRKQGSGTERALDEALNDLRSAEADLAAANADFDKANIVAPFAGLIGLRQVSLGQYLKAGDPIATLADVDHLRIDFRVSETYLTEISKDQIVSVTFDALPGETFQGAITAIDPVIDVSGRAISVRAALTNESGKLRPGIFGRVNIVTATRHSVVLPESALVPQKTGEKAVFVVVDKGEAGLHAELRPIEIGERLAGEIEVRSGVNAGERIVTAGQLKVRPDDQVFLREEKPAATDVPASDDAASAHKG